MILLKLCVFLIAVIHLIQPVLAVDLSTLLFGCSVITLIIAIPHQSPGFRKITLAFLAIGILCLAKLAVSMTTWIQYTNSMTNIIAILVVMQLFTIPIDVGNYSLAIEYWLYKSLKKETHLFLFTTFMTHLFSCFLLFGTVPVMVSLFGKALAGKVTDFKRFIAAAVARGYALVVLWAPGAVNVFLVMQATGVKWTELFIPGAILSVIGLLTSIAIEKASYFREGFVTGGLHTQTVSRHAARTKIAHIILVVIGLLLLIMILEKLKIGSSSSRILYAGGVVSISWLSLYTRDSKLPAVLKNYWKAGVPKALDLSALFIAMGIFAGAVDRTGLLQFGQPILQEAILFFGNLSYIVIPIIMIFLAVIGIHPFVVIVMLGKILTAVNLQIPPISLAICLAVGGAISYMLSPFAGIVLMLSKFLDAKATDITFRWNLLFSIVFLVEGAFFAYVWGLLNRGE